jgi:hypothetical protein
VQVLAKLVSVQPMMTKKQKYMYVGVDISEKIVLKKEDKKK